MLKALSNFTGAVLIGFGLGIILAQNWHPANLVYLIVLIVSLVAGGFLIALRPKRKIKTSPAENLRQEGSLPATKDGERI